MSVTNSRILVLFDVCGTLVHTQLANTYIAYLLSRSLPQSRAIRKSLKTGLDLLYKMSVLTGSQYKRFLTYLVRGLCIEDLQTLSTDFVKEVMLRDEIPETQERLRTHLRQGHEVLFVSGGYVEYLEIYARNKGVQRVIGTRIKKNNRFVSGGFDGPDCMGNTKLLNLVKEITLSDYDLKKSYCYTDSLTDLPLLQMVGNKIVIAKTPHPPWLKNIEAEVITLPKKCDA